MHTVLVLGTFDTKQDELDYVCLRLVELGNNVLTVDVGVLDGPAAPVDISRGEVAAAAGTTIEALVRDADRGRAMAAMANGAAALVRKLYAHGRFDAIVNVSGSGGAAVAAEAMRNLPPGLPKMIVSTVVAGDVRPYLGDTEIDLVYPVVDMAGLNRISERVLWNAAAAVDGMTKAAAAFEPRAPDWPLVGMTIFGITTPCVARTRSLLGEQGLETVVFNANGMGGASMERLMYAGTLVGAVDVTTTELADELLGGILPSGESRFVGFEDAPPRVIAPGALDVVNFGPASTVPELYRGRLLHDHNPAVTLMRTSPSESALLGAELATRLERGGGPATVVLPLRGFSSLSAPGQPFHDPEADAALIEVMRAQTPAMVDLVEVDASINDPEFAGALAVAYRELSRSRETRIEP